MFIVSVLAMTATLAAVVWSTAQRRESERELVFIGRQFEAAIERYRQRSPDPVAPYPLRLEDLLQDDRGVRVQRHLRRLYVDPMTGDARWGLIRLAGGGIVGVHSLSDRRPYPRRFVDSSFVVPVGGSYRDWRFIAPGAAELLLSGAGPVMPSSTSPAGVEPPTVAEAVPAPSNAEPAGPAVDPEGAPSAGVARPTPQDYRSRTPEACDRIASHEDQVCRDTAARIGDEAGRACHESALARNVACSLGQAGALPPLVRRAN